MGRQREFDQRAVTARALDLFWRRGYEATSIDDLCRHLGLGRASLYNAFGDKRGVLEAALRLYGDASCSALASFAAREESGRDVIETMLRWQGEDAFSSHHPHGCFFLTMATELREEDAGVVACAGDGLARIQNTFESLLRRGRADGSLTGAVDVVELARYLTGVMVAVRTLARIGASPEVAQAMLRAAQASLN